MPAIIDVIMRGVQREAGNVMDFLTTPKGPFETVDAVVKDARLTAREALEQVGVSVPTLRGLGGRLGQRLRR